MGTLIAFRGIVAEAPTIVRYCQNTIGYCLCALTSCFRLWLLIARRAPSFPLRPVGEAVRCSRNGSVAALILHAYRSTFYISSLDVAV